MQAKAEFSVDCRPDPWCNSDATYKGSNNLTNRNCNLMIMINNVS